MFRGFLIALLFLAAAAATAAWKHHTTPPQKPHYGKKPVLEYYKQSCPDAEKIAREVLTQIMQKEFRNGSSLMRLAFHDCFVSGCDGSVLLDDTATMTGEKEALANTGSLRSFDSIDTIKTALENKCPGKVSCADIITMAARDAIHLAGGPLWKVKLGRLDSLKASQQNSSDIIPSSNDSNVTSLIELFSGYNLSVSDLVALSGTHTIGEVRCFSATPRIYDFQGRGGPEPKMNFCYRKKLDNTCKPDGSNENKTLPLDPTPKKFDNQYFKALLQHKAALHSDQVLIDNPETLALVEKYAKYQDLFFMDLVTAMIKMTDLVYLDHLGEVRLNCRYPNGQPPSSSKAQPPQAVHGDGVAESSSY